jgi:signal transduction histidine kinase/ActR/RegA family two-component response regulator
MSPALRLQRLEALTALVAGFARPDDGFLEDALDALVDATPARAAAALANDARLQPRAERRLGDPVKLSLSGQGAALRVLADRAIRAGEVLKVVELGSAGDEMDLSLLHAGCALCAPLVTSSGESFAIILLFDDAAMLDEETRSFVDTVLGITVLALDRHHARSLLPRSSGPIEVGRGPDLDLYAKSIAQEILGPAAALELQQAELCQIGEQLRKLGDPADTLLGDWLAEMTDVLSEMGSAVARVRDTGHGLLSSEREPPARLDLADVVAAALDPTRAELERRGIELHARLVKGCLVLGLRRNLSRVAQQLVSYAADTSAGASPPEVSVSVLAEDASVVLEVQYSGESTAERTLSDLTRPLSSARHQRSVALKLATAVIAAHGGHLEIGTSAGGGSSFRVVLPAASALIASMPPSLGAFAQPAGKRQQILIVDDEPLFSRTIRRGLRPHDVRIAGTASEAELLLLDLSYEPDLVVCDVLLPGAHGHVLHQRVRAARPEIAARFVFVTSGALRTDEADYLRASGCATLLKPFDVAGLLELVATRAAEAMAVRTLVPTEPPREPAPG